MFDDHSRLNELAEQFENGTSTSRRYAVFIKNALGAVRDGQKDEGLVFEREIVEAFSQSHSGQKMLH